MLSRADMEKYKPKIAADRLELKGGTFAGKPAAFWGLHFVNGGLYRGAVLMKSYGNRDKEFEEMKQLLSQKYGRPSVNVRKDKERKAV